MSGKINTSQRLHEDLGRLISSLQAGDRLPAEPTLAKQLGVSRATLREAMRTYETQGLIHRRQGAGTYVTRPSQIIESGLEVLESLDTLAGRIDLPVTAGERWIASRTATPAEAQVLGIAPDSQVLVVSRVILAEGHAAAYLIDILPEDILSAEDLGEALLGERFAFLETTLIPGYRGFLLLVLPAGGFIALAFLMAAKRAIDRRVQRRRGAHSRLDVTTAGARPA